MSATIIRFNTKTPLGIAKVCFRKQGYLVVVIMIVLNGHTTKDKRREPLTKTLIISLEWNIRRRI